MRHCLLIIFFAIGSVALYAQVQPVSYPFIRIGSQQGLSYNEVHAIYKDDRGFMWVGTMSGLNRYDGHEFRVFRHDQADSGSIGENTIKSIQEGPEHRLWIQFIDNSFNIYDPRTETFERDFNRALDALAIPRGSISNIIKDKTGCFWFVEPTRGLYRFDPIRRRSTLIVLDPGEPPIATDNIADITTDIHGRCWIIRRDGLLEALDSGSLRIRVVDRTITRASSGQLLDYNLYADAQGDLWVYCTGDARGIWYYKASDHSLLHLDKNTGSCRLNNDIVRDVVQDDAGMIWIGTDHGGVNLLNKTTLSMRYLEHNDFDDNSVSQNAITCLYKDNTGIVWVGTYKQGLSVYHPRAIRFPLYRHHPFTPGSLSFDDVNRFVEDAKGNLWIGTNGGGLIYFDRSSGTFTPYVHDPRNPNSPCSDVIISLCIDHQGMLWTGSYFGGLDRFDGHTFTHYRHRPNDSTSLGDDRVWEIFEDKWNQLWVGTLAAGLDLMDREHGRFRHFVYTDQPATVKSNYISELTQDTAGNLWIGTGIGIDVLEHRTGRFLHFDQSSGINSRNVIALVTDSLGRVWIGTSEGLNLFDPTRGKTIRVWNKADGLPDNYIVTIVEDARHNLWLGTPNGLCNAVLHYTGSDPIPQLEPINYDESSGLQSRQFNENAALRTREGALVFGGPNGFNVFNPETIQTQKQAPALVLTDLQVFNRSVAPGDQLHGRTLLAAALPATDRITLRYNENVIALSFADLDFSGNQKTTYAYRLDGFSQDWLVLPAHQWSATYTNLDPGTYVFRIRAQPSAGVGPSREASLVIHVLPPFWKTPLAFVLYALFVIGLLLLARKILVERTRMRFRIEQERKEAQNMHELDMMKIRFFTNVSHEFRTPLSLILAPLEKLMAAAATGGTPGPGGPQTVSGLQTLSGPQTVSGVQTAGGAQTFQLMYRNARRLLNLVNQLLDFRRMEVQEFTLQRSSGDLVRYVQELTQSFSDISEKRHIALHFQAQVAECVTVFDRDKLEKIVFNLLSNAFKFTPEGGKVDVTVAVDGVYAEIRVTDTGIGIPGDQQERIFERFFQHDLPGNMINQGSGIGLALTKEFVKLHQGTIAVESEPDKGSCFIVRLPLVRETPDLRPAPEPAPAVWIAPAGDAADVPEPGRPRKRPTLLLVEDNEDFRFYLKDNLRAHYHVIEAANGKEGLKKVQSLQPDLVVSDIMMPEMDGIALARRIKQDAQTSHIPVILLTARADEEQQLEGYGTGANDYITKPFNFELLLARIRNLLAQRRHAQRQFSKNMEVNPSPAVVTPLDQQFLQQALEAVEARLSDPDFSVEDLSRALHFSRVTLYKKLSSLTGKAPLDFIRHIRLKRAADLLSRSQLTVAEIAYEVGFNNPKYFAKFFKKEFGVLPSAYKQQYKRTD
jgi:signal transduction histidine kinase/ligand-binding sensor domain-containing protein/DNA-binding response OmpR family regulator